MGWDAILLPLLVAALVIFLPGLLIGFFGRLRWPVLLGAAPVISMAVIGLAAVIAPVVGLDWSILPVLALAIAMAAAAGGMALVGRRAGWGRGESDPLGSRLAVLGGVGLGAAVAAIALFPGLARSDAVSQTYDAVFHYNAVRWVLDGGNASPLYVGTMSAPGTTSSFYPATWHALVALVMQMSGADILVSPNAVSVVIAALVWPAACVLLVRQILGPHPGAILAAGIVSGFSTAFPTQLLSFGVLWPNALAYAGLPAALALVVALCGLASRSAVGPVAAMAALVMAVVGLGLAHPNAVFALAVLALPLAVLAAWQLSRSHWGTRRFLVTLLPWAGIATSVVAVHVVLRRVPALGGVTTFDWPARMTVAQAFGEVLLQATRYQEAAWVLAITVVIGLVVTGRDPRLRWIPFSFAAAAALYALAAGSDSDLAQTLTGPWYNDSFRLAALLPVVVVPLTVVGLISMSDWAATWFRAHVPASAGRYSRPGVALLVLLSLVVVVTRVGYAPARIDLLAGAYTFGATQQQSPLLTTGEYGLIRELPALVPEGVGVAGNPWDGSALSYAIASRPVPFPHLIGAWDEPREVIAQRLRLAASDPAVCRALDELGIGYAIEGGEPLRDEPPADEFPGIDGLGAAKGFDRVASGGGMVLYEITACS